MSRVCLDTLKGLPSNNNFITLLNDTKLKIPETLVQTVVKRVDTKVKLNVPLGATPTLLSALDITITPKFADSLLLFQYMINYECTENIVFLMCKDGALITTPKYESYNRNSGNVVWSGLMSARYDRNIDTTPENLYLQYSTIAETTDVRTYNLGLRSNYTDGGYMFALNSNFVFTETSAVETNISVITVMEIAQ